eukprot:TRINITY_DN2670_c4_g1_i1.p1 TRINITY_DN2670_c4_g1~~TRINITY_DN2670_c4_g1_i1.p1  ORF type:complete len:399 (+),score=46.73 TRINITY_DN2670_c4_g1_i1:87-1283(+)
MHSFVQLGCYRTLNGLSEARRAKLTALAQQVFSTQAVPNIGADNIVEMLTPDFEIGKPEVLLLGESNAGKSSLIKKSFSTSKVRVGYTPGLTKLLTRHIQNNSLAILDAPGYGYVLRNRRVPLAILQQRLLQQYIQARCSTLLHRAYLLVPVLPSGSLSPADLSMIATCKLNRVPLTIIVSKIDKVGETSSNATCLQIMEQEPLADVIPFSTKIPDTIRLFREDVLHACTSWLPDEDLNLKTLQSLKYQMPMPTREELEGLLKDTPLNYTQSEVNALNRKSMGLSGHKASTRREPAFVKDEKRLMRDLMDVKYGTQKRESTAVTLDATSSLITSTKFLSDKDLPRKRTKSLRANDIDYSISENTKMEPKGGRFKRDLRMTRMKRNSKNERINKRILGA